MKFLDIDGPFMSLLTAIADMIILNLLTLFCCLPVITAGAAFTALHYVVLKQVRGDSPYVIRSFFKSFKQNFLQATGIWLFCLIIIGIDAMGVSLEDIFISLVDKQETKKSVKRPAAKQ